MELFCREADFCPINPDIIIGIILATIINNVKNQLPTNIATNEKIIKERFFEILKYWCK